VSNIKRGDDTGALCQFIHELLSNRYKLITNVRSSLVAVNIHITIIELNALHTKRQNLFQELDAVIHLLMEAKHWGLRKSRNATRSEERRVGKESRYRGDEKHRKERSETNEWNRSEQQ